MPIVAGVRRPGIGRMSCVGRVRPRASLSGAYLRIGSVGVVSDTRSLLEVFLPRIVMLLVMLMRHTPPEYRIGGRQGAPGSLAAAPTSTSSETTKPGNSAYAVDAPPVL